MKNQTRARLDTVNGNGRRRYATVAEAAEYVGVHPITIRAMFADGRLTRYQMGPRVLRVDLNEIDAVMAGQTGQSA